MANDFSNFTDRDNEQRTQRSEDSPSRRVEGAAVERRYFAEDGEENDLSAAARRLGGRADEADQDESSADIDAGEVRRAYAATAELEKPKTMAYSVTALVFSVLSIICCCSGFVSALFGILAIVFAIVSRRHLTYFDSMAIISLIIGIIGAILGLFVGLVTLFGIVGDIEIFEQAFGDIQTNL